MLARSMQSGMVGTIRPGEADPQGLKPALGTGLGGTSETRALPGFPFMNNPARASSSLGCATAAQNYRSAQQPGHVM